MKYGITHITNDSITILSFKIQFKETPFFTCKEMIGELKMPFFTKRNMQRRKIFGASSIRDCAYFKKNKILLIDNGENALFEFEERPNGHSVKKLQHEKLMLPRRLCVGKNDEIFILTCIDYTVEVFEIKEDELCHKRRMPYRPTGLVNIKIDLHDENKHLLYMTDIILGKLNVINADSGRLITSIKLEIVDSLAFTRDFLYAGADCEFDVDRSGKLLEITNASNCIFKISKATYEVIEKIEFDNWLQPIVCGLDTNENLYAVAYEVEKNKVVSSKRYLHIINKDRVVMQKIRLEDDDCETTIFHYFNNQLITSQEDSINLFLMRFLK